MDLSVRVKGIKFKNPVIIASGPAGFGKEFFEYVSPSKIGAFTTKTVTPRPIEGNIPPRLFYTEGGLLNSIGLQNPGLELFISDFAPYLPKECVKIISIGGENPDDFSEMIEGVEKFADMIEINLSCPNVSSGTISSDSVLSGEVISACRSATKKPLIAKLSPGDDVISQAKVAIDSGADILNVGNSIQGARFNIETGRPILKKVRGGLSGPALMPVILWNVYRIKEAFPDVPVIGLGGVRKAEDIIEYVMAGATLVGIGTQAMIDPESTGYIIDGVEKILNKKGINFENIIGISLRGGFR